jgi:competence protein ComGC
MRFWNWKHNNKGVAVIDDIVVIAVIGAIIFFAGPPLVKSIGTLFNGGDKNQAKQIHKIDSTRTLYELDPVTNKMKPVKETYSEYSNQSTAQEPPETLWQKFWHLGFIAVAIIVLLSYLGLWPIITLWWNKKVKPKIVQAQTDLENVQAEKDELRGDAKLIVKSVDEGLAAMNTAIVAAQSTYDTAQTTLNAAALINDSALRIAAITNAQTAVANAQAVLDAVTNVKKDFLSAMSRKQDTTTKLLVAELKND